MVDTIHSCTCPQKTRTKNRRSEQALWRGRKRWKNFVAEYCHDPTAVCVHCGKHHREPRKNGKLTFLTINHLSRSLYNDEELYHTWNPNLMEVCCTMCNWMYESGKKSCPVCHNAYISCMEPDNMCQSCYDKAHPEEASIRIAKNKKKKDDAKALKKSLRDAEKAKAKQWKKDHPVVKYKPGHQTKVAEEAGTHKVPLKQEGEDAARRKAYNSGWF